MTRTCPECGHGDIRLEPEKRPQIDMAPSLGESLAGTPIPLPGVDLVLTGIGLAVEAAGSLCEALGTAVKPAETPAMVAYCPQCGWWEAATTETPPRP
ncbi:hypothetical protein [Paramagnetospirillum magneticum]|uniref:Uncharacterized protein n=1 Tax=Paramagnetospirillum magneticum (strain ATCC 700264 / AMB-1) TaxID=342108 RepID=Q2W099_PARM1|nr:hypothetical protein [Paramagnetospirillum magneticum]BAE52726.1 hypothetical protein amb3922 [Paramagnetospirillum magneticum AMB-1]